ncbi:hypothetical protein BDV95DRAFT_613032 [Massariosphaeria phaeospora]|uniref:Uncharacterized protein n=1 Tax=Massariosphaeria phaeospora TaxID=100035 RepID=A0A7C8I4R1_9PLEO|nr:hypothetical protein BDV95DRAFT_613032 [Massariosphaeria phaeospora]
MVGWQGNARWAHVDIFNLLGIDPRLTDLTWEMVDARPRQIIKQLRPNDPAIVPPNGVSIALVNSFRSELFELVYPSVQRGEELQAGDATPDSRRDLAQALDKINKAKLIGHTRTWDAENGVPSNWLGVNAALNYSNTSGDMPAGSLVATPSYGIAAAQTDGAAGSSSAMNTYVEKNEPGETNDTSIPLDSDGTCEDPIDFSGNVASAFASASASASAFASASASASASADNIQALVLMPLHQRDKFMQLAMWDAAPANFKYVIAPSRLRAMAQKYTNNKSAVVIGVVRRPDWNAAQTFPEYICIAALEGGNALRIRVKQWSVGGNALPRWPGGGSIYLSLEEIRQQGYLFRPFCDNFDKERLRKYLTVMEKKGKMPMVKDKALVLRGG